MRVEVDDAACVGQGTCEALAEAVFEVGADGISRVLADPVPPELEEAVRDAVLQCPTGALRTL